VCGVVCSLRSVGKAAGLPEALQGVLRGLDGCVEWCVAYGENCCDGVCVFVDTIIYVSKKVWNLSLFTHTVCLTDKCHKVE